MWKSRNKARTTEHSRRIRLLIWAALIALICGVIDLGSPVESRLRIIRNHLRAQDASGQIVMIAIDGQSITGNHRWPWPRRDFAKMTDVLREAGASKIFFDLDFSTTSNAEDDQAFADAIKRADGKVVLPSRFIIDRLAKRRTELVPEKMFGEHAKIGNINVYFNAFSEAWQIPYAMDVAGKPYSSYASIMAGRFGESGSSFRVDYSIKVSSIKTISAVDVLENRLPENAISGKIVIISPVSDQLGDTHVIPGQGRLPGGYIQIVGAETLMKGQPFNTGWVWAFLLGLVVAGSYLFIRSNRLFAATCISGASILLFGPLYLESRLIFVDIVPGLLVLSIVSIRAAWIWVKRRGQTINPVSGLPNLSALVATTTASGSIMVVARIQNFAEITATLEPALEREFVVKIASRLALGAGRSAIYQGDEGIFVWLVSAANGAPGGAQLDALHSLFRNPILIGARRIDLKITFGIESGEARSVENRLGSALVAAEEAAREGLRWKGFDQARLDDADWKLSLLGRLDQAIDDGEIWVAYQPQYDLKAQRVIGAEALARWSHPERGEIGPDDFVLAAERENRIEKLTDHVLEQAIKAAALINRHGIDFTIAVNISARLLAGASLVANVRSLLRKYQLPSERLSLELTETATMASNQASIATLNELRAMGVGISIDDYGTGLSTLEYLKLIPATEIKIDKSFVQNIDANQSDQLLVRSTIELAHSLGCRVVAEGVERRDTMEALAAMGCDHIQGFLIGAPMHFRGLSRLLLSEEKRWAA